MCYSVHLLFNAGKILYDTEKPFHDGTYIYRNSNLIDGNGMRKIRRDIKVMSFELKSGSGNNLPKISSRCFRLRRLTDVHKCDTTNIYVFKLGIIGL